MVDYAKLKKLREETGYSFSLIKKVLEETDNDIEKTKKKLKQEAGAAAVKKGEKETSQGGIFTYVHHNRKVASLVELACETDFVSGNEDFRTLGQEIAMQAASVAAKDAKELLGQEYIRDASKKVKDLLEEAVAKFGENIKLVRVARWEIGGQ